MPGRRVRFYAAALAGFVTLPATPLPAAAQSDGGAVEVSGYIAGDLRLFPEDAVQAGQKDQHVNPSLVLQPAFSLAWNDGYDRIDVTPFARLDFQDRERRHADLREAKYLHIGADWDLRVGVDKVFWGVMESRHLVDIVNQTDAVEDTDGEDKLGQPMINLGLQRAVGDFNLLVMPYFRERTFPGPDGRLRGTLPVDTDQARYESGLDRWHSDVALRYSTFVGAWDIGVAHFRGTSREPRLTPGTGADGNAVLVPRYDVIDQTSLDLQATTGAWLWKTEALYRSGYEGADPFGAVSAGFEYTAFGTVGDAGDLGLLAEYHFDDRGEGTPGTPFDDDLFLGARATLNDTQDTDFLAGVLIDRHSHARSYTIEADRRLDDLWSVELEGRAYGAVPESDPGSGLRDDHHLQIRLYRYF